MSAHNRIATSPAEEIAERLGIPRSEWGLKKEFPWAGDDTDWRDCAAQTAPAVAACYRSWHRYDTAGEYADIAVDALWDALRSFDPDRGKPASWVRLLVERRLASAYRKTLRRQETTRQLRPEACAWDPADQELAAQASDTLAVVASCIERFAERLASKPKTSEWEAEWVREIASHVLSGDSWPSPTAFAERADAPGLPAERIISRCQKLSTALRKEIAERLSDTDDS